MSRVAWAEMILLPFVEVVSIGFERLLLILGGCAQTSHTPSPSREGRFGCCVLVGSESVIWEYSGCLGAVRAAVWRAFGRDGCKLK